MGNFSYIKKNSHLNILCPKPQEKLKMHQKFGIYKSLIYIYEITIYNIL